MSSSAFAVSIGRGVGEASTKAFSATISTPRSPISVGITSDAAERP